MGPNSRPDLPKSSIARALFSAPSPSPPRATAASSSSTSALLRLPLLSRMERPSLRKRALASLFPSLAEYMRRCKFETPLARASRLVPDCSAANWSSWSTCAEMPVRLDKSSMRPAAAAVAPAAAASPTTVAPTAAPRAPRPVRTAAMAFSATSKAAPSTSSPRRAKSSDTTITFRLSPTPLASAQRAPSSRATD
jgi:hypothetical protein